MQEFTHFNLLEITQQEQELKLLLCSENKEDIQLSPKKSTSDTIINYSKALSVRKSKNIDFIEMLLN